MTEAGDYYLLQSKRKAISALLPYAVWQEQDGKPEALGAFLSAARASKQTLFAWRRTGGFSGTQLSEGGPWAIVLVTPHILYPIDGANLFQHWAAATSAVPHTEEVAQSVVDALLQFTFKMDLLRHITLEMWSWFKMCPSLPPVCWGRENGTYQSVVDEVRGLGDIGILKSYLLLVWSEWGAIRSSGFDEMCASIPEDFGEIGMGHHRADLIQRLDHILGELDQGLEYLQQHNPGLSTDDVQKMEHQYRELRNILLEINIKAITRMSNPTAMLACTLTHGYTQNPIQHLCVHSLSHVHSLLSGNIYLAHFPSPSPTFAQRLLYPCPFITHLIMPSPHHIDIGPLFPWTP